MRNNRIFNLLFIVVNFLAFFSYAADFQVEGLETEFQFLEMGNLTPLVEPKLVEPFDKSKITTLAVAVRLKESQVHFFGGHRVYVGTGNGFAKETITHNGRILDSRSIKSQEDIDIPMIFLDGDKVSFLFEKSENGSDQYGKMNKQQALLRQKRKVISKMETNPKETIYMEISPISDDFIHLIGDITKINRLPEGLKVSKIIVEYLGDDLFAKKDFDTFDWSFLKNLRNLLSKGGTILFEMRADTYTRQDKAPVLEELTEELKKAKWAVEEYIRQWSSLGCADEEGIRGLLQHKRNVKILKLNRSFTDQEIDLIFGHLHPEDSLPDPSIKISEILENKFRENGFNRVSSSFNFAHNRQHIPTRFYNTVVIEAYRD